MKFLFELPKDPILPFRGNQMTILNCDLFIISKLVSLLKHRNYFQLFSASRVAAELVFYRLSCLFSIPARFANRATQDMRGGL